MHLTPKRAEISASVVLSNYMKYNTFQKLPKIFRVSLSLFLLFTIISVVQKQ